MLERRIRENYPRSPLWAAASIGGILGLGPTPDHSGSSPQSGCQPRGRSVSRLKVGGSAPSRFLRANFPLDRTCILCNDCMSDFRESDMLLGISRARGEFKPFPVRFPAPC